MKKSAKVGQPVKKPNYSKLLISSLLIVVVLLTTSVFARSAVEFDFPPEEKGSIELVLYGTQFRTYREEANILRELTKIYDQKIEDIGRDLNSTSRIISGIFIQIKADSSTSDTLVTAYTIDRPDLNERKKFDFKAIAQNRLPHAAGSIRKIVLMQNVLVVFTDKLGMYTYRLISKNEQAYIERVDIEVPAQIVREALLQQVAAVARSGAKHYYIGLNGSLQSHSVGSKVWAFDGTTGQVISSERFIREITSINIKEPRQRRGESKIHIDFRSTYSRTKGDFFTLDSLASNRICRTLDLKNEGCE